MRPLNNRSLYKIEHSKLILSAAIRPFRKTFCSKLLTLPDCPITPNEGSRATFLEDVDFLEAVQTNRVDGSLDGLIHLAADAAQLQVRRMLGSMISAEQV